jgi:hypothetical protein
MVPASLRTLLSGLIDYAGTFPPAGLPLVESVARYVEYRNSPFAWMLGRLVVSSEDVGAVDRLLAATAPAERVPVSVTIARPDQLEQLASQALRQAQVASIEVRGNVPNLVRDMAVAATAAGVSEVYGEVEPSDELPATLDALAGVQWRAKLRTGGIAADLFPTPAAVAGFIAGCRNRDLAFKVTAGLHHPIRAEYPLTYESITTCGLMHGFLNVAMSAAVAAEGAALDEIMAVLEDTDATHFSFDDEMAQWKGRQVPLPVLRRTRRAFVSVGSCSFDEPIADLRTLGLL